MKNGEMIFRKVGRLCGAGYITAEYIEQIPMYKLNKKWVEQIQLEGFTIIDIGYPQGLTSESLFYNMEINTINW